MFIVLNNMFTSILQLSFLILSCGGNRNPAAEPEKKLLTQTLIGYLPVFLTKTCATKRESILSS